VRVCFDLDTSFQVVEGILGRRNDQSIATFHPVTLVTNASFLFIESAIRSFFPGYPVGPDRCAHKLLVVVEQLHFALPVSMLVAHERGRGTWGP
jgi:hypothetical protein